MESVRCWHSVPFIVLRSQNDALRKSVKIEIAKSFSSGSNSYFIFELALQIWIKTSELNQVGSSRPKHLLQRLNSNFPASRNFSHRVKIHNFQSEVNIYAAFRLLSSEYCSGRQSLDKAHGLKLILLESEIMFWNRPAIRRGIHGRTSKLRMPDQTLPDVL